MVRYLVAWCALIASVLFSSSSYLFADPPHFLLQRSEFSATAQPQQDYLIPARFTQLVHAIRRSGIEVEELLEDVVAPIEIDRLTSVTAQPSHDAKRSSSHLRISSRVEHRLIPAGTMLVRTSQSRGELATALLDARSQSNLLQKHLHDSEIHPGMDAPVFRLARHCVIMTGPPRPLPEHEYRDQPITDDVLISRGPQFLGGSPVAGITWLPDGEHYLQAKGGKLLKVHARTGDSLPFVDPDAVSKSLTVINELDRQSIDRIANGTTFQMNPPRTGFLVAIGPDYGFAYFDGRPAVRLTRSGPGKEFVTFSPDGKRIAFVHGGNLFASAIDEPGEKQLTTDAGGDILNARGDWVYEEEIFLRNARAYWWSSDGNQLAFMRFDDSPVHKFNIVDFKDTRGRLESISYPKAGDPNPLVSIGVVSSQGGKPKYLSLGSYNPKDMVVSRVGWIPQSNRVFAYIQNRTQTWLDFVVWDSVEAKPKTLFRETTPAWVEDLGEPHFLPDGSFLVSSERTGWKHLYHYSAQGTLIRAVTKGDWEVRTVHRVDQSSGWVYFTGTKDGHTRSHLYRAQLDGSGSVDRLTTPEGTHTITLAPVGQLFVDRYSDEKTPAQLRLHEIGQEKPIRHLDKNPVYEKDGFRMGRYERVQVPMKDGFVLEGSLTYPPDFNPEKKYPIWLMTYAGPNAPTVRDGFGSGRGFEQTLATSGIVVFRVDPRSASGKNAAATWTCYKQLGVQELRDLEEAVAWIGTNPWADMTRVGISGHSYGGFMAAFALTHSKMFSAGIASSPVTDWRLYDSIYTERYMLTPSENPKGYDDSSCIKAARNLNGKLLIIHGMMDDNVHMQNSTQLIDALQRSNKEFEMMFYPQARHGIGGAHYTRTELDFIRRTMGVKK